MRGVTPVDVEIRPDLTAFRAAMARAEELTRDFGDAVRRVVDAIPEDLRGSSWSR